MSRRLVSVVLIAILAVSCASPAYAGGLDGLTWDQVMPTTQADWEYLRVSGELNAKVKAWSASQAEAFSAYAAEMGYAGFTPETATVGQVGAWTGQTPSQVVQSAKTAEAAIKSTGVRLSPSALKSAGVGLAVGLALEYGADWVVDKVFGPHQWFNSQGEAVGDDYFMLHPFSKSYLYQGDGLLLGEEIDPEIAWMFPGFEIPGAVTEDYIFTAQYPVAASEFVASSAVWRYPPYSFYPNNTYVWLSDGYVLAELARVCNGNAARPLQPVWSLNQSTQARLGGFRNVVTGESFTLTPSKLNWILWSPDKCVYWEGTSSSELAGAAGALLDAYDSEIAEMLASGAITAAREPDVAVAGISVPLPDAAELPNVYEYDGSGVTSTTPVVDAVDALSVPGSVPEPVVAAGADPDAASWADTVTPVLAELQASAAGRWPFAGIWVFGYLIDGETCTADIMEWDLELQPIWLFGGGEPPPIRIHLAPATWGGPLQPYRWVGVGAIALGLLFALFGLLKPRVNV